MMALLMEPDNVHLTGMGFSVAKRLNRSALQVNFWGIRATAYH
jgi:hypothetical protein